MADADDVRRLALALPDVTEIDSDGFDFRVAGKGFIWSYPERRPGKPRLIRTDIAVLFVGDEAEKLRRLAAGDAAAGRGGRRAPGGTHHRRMADACPGYARNPPLNPGPGPGIPANSTATALNPMNVTATGFATP
jgi:hypothetical protein